MATSEARDAASDQRQSESLPASAVVRLAIWFGLLAGFGEVAQQVILKVSLHRYLHPDARIAWMALVTDMGLFTVFGFVLAGLSKLLPRWGSLRNIVCLLAALCVGTLLLRFTWLYSVARWLLAAGCAVQLARFSATHRRGFDALVRRTWVWLLVIAAASIAAVPSWDALAERRAIASLPPPATGAPNVLLIVLDTVRAEDLSVYGYVKRTTPRLEELAATGVRFDRAISASPWTLPSHASIFTGRSPHQLSADWERPLDATYPTLAEVLRAHGYLTAGFVANVIYGSRESGLSRGFAHYEDFLVSPGQVMVDSMLGARLFYNLGIRGRLGYHDLVARKNAETVTREFLAWLPHNTERPFFAFLNYFDAHLPYLPPPPFYGKFGPKRPAGRDPLQWNPGGSLPAWTTTPQGIRAERAAYDGAIGYIDAQLGTLFDTLRARGRLTNTLVIVAGDHGEEFREHGFFGHGNHLYLTLLHVPLLLSFPGRVPAGASVVAPVSLSDLAATVTDLVGLGGTTGLPGSSLARYWDGRHEAVAAVPLFSEVNYARNRPERYPSARGRMESLLLGRHHYIKSHDGEEVYDWHDDPGERYDLAASVQGRQLIAQFRSMLAALLASPPR